MAGARLRTHVLHVSRGRGGNGAGPSGTKCQGARRLLPFLCLCYAVNFLDRVNVGFAALAMNQDLGFTPSIFGAGAGIFFIGYLLLALTLATVGIYAAVSIFWSLSTAILTGTEAAAGARPRQFD